MTFFRSKSIGEELLGRAQRIAGAATDRHPREALGAARDYAGQAGVLATRVIGSTGREIRRHPRMGIALGASLGLGAIAAAYLISRRHARERDEQEAAWRRPADGDTVNGSGQDNTVPAETDLY